MNRPTDPGSIVRRIALTVAASTTCLAVLSGCSDIQAQLSGQQSSEPLESTGLPGPAPSATEVAPAPSPTETPVPAESEGGQPIAALQTVNWGTVDGLLSVVVKNGSRHTLSRAVAAVTAKDANGVVLASPSATAPSGRCCTVVDLPPGGAYGFYFDLGPDAAAVASVELTYRDIDWAPTEPGATAPMQASAVGVEAGAQGAVVVADVTTPEAPVTEAIVQAYLVGPDGAFVAVVSGQWSCFAAGETRRIEMQLFHPVPDGTAVHSMVAYPGIDPPQSTGPSCPA